MFSNSLHTIRRHHVGPDDYEGDAANTSLDLRYAAVQTVIKGLSLESFILYLYNSK
jgi:hypothetical protein